MTPWEDPQWRDEVDRWIAAQLTAAGRTVTGDVTQPHVRPWSTALRVPTGDGVVWFKANAPGPSYEAGVYEVLARHGLHQVLQPIAYDLTRGWLLLPDGGRTLRSLHEEQRDLSHWPFVLAGYAALQQAATPLADELLAAGVPDLRPETMPAELTALLAAHDDLLLDRPGGLTREQHDRLTALVPTFTEWCTELASYGIGPTLQHDDLHDNNVLVRDGSYAVFDWGDSSIAHPFGTMLVLLRSIAGSFGFAEDGAEIARLRDSYLELWTGEHQLEALRKACALAERIAKVSRSLSWRTALAHLPVSERGEFAAAVPGWLEDLLEPDAT